MVKRYDEQGKSGPCKGPVGSLRCASRKNSAMLTSPVGERSTTLLHHGAPSAQAHRC